MIATSPLEDPSGHAAGALEVVGDTELDVVDVFRERAISRLQTPEYRVRAPSRWLHGKPLVEDPSRSLAHDNILYHSLAPLSILRSAGHVLSGEHGRIQACSL